MYEVDVLGSAERTLRVALDDVGAMWDLGSGGVLTIRLTDQSALIAVIETLHELGVAIEQVRRLR